MNVWTVKTEQQQWSLCQKPSFVRLHNIEPVISVHLLPGSGPIFKLITMTAIIRRAGPLNCTQRQEHQLYV